MSDYIEREAALAYPIRKDKCDRKHANEHFILGIESVIEFVENLPAADVAPVRHGRWIPSDYIGDCCYTCSECGFERDVYLLDVGDYCPACGARMDKEDNMNKPLSEWTLGEVKAECEKHTAHCVGCPLWTDAAGCRLDTSCYRDNDPKIWDLSEPPRWTEQDKEDARKIKAMLPAGVALEMVRLEPGTLRLVIVDELSFVSLNKNLLPSLKPGERATLDEIIGGTNE